MKAMFYFAAAFAFMGGAMCFCIALNTMQLGGGGLLTQSLCAMICAGLGGAMIGLSRKAD